MEETVDIWEKLVVRGLNSVIQRKEHQGLKTEILTSYPDILETRLSAVDIGIQMRIVEGMLVDNPAVFEEDFWADYITKALKNFDNDDNSYVYNNGAWFVLLNRIRDMKEEVDWFGVLSRLSSATAHAGSKAQGFTTVLGWLIAADKENLLKLLHKTETKKYPRKLKLELYKQLIEFGLLDVKVARRIRSDTSGELSSKVLAHLFENRSAYSNDDFKELITQFTDTRHKWVARYIAINMPMELTAFLMGIKDQTALKILEKRMNAAEV